MSSRVLLVQFHIHHVYHFFLLAATTLVFFLATFFTPPRTPVLLPRPTATALALPC